MIKDFFLLNIPIHSANINVIEEKISSILNSKNKISCLITTFNLDFLRISTIDNNFQEIVKNSLYNFPDGYGIIHLIKKKFNIKIKRITGSDLFLLIIKLGNKFNKKIAIIGSENHVSKKAENILINKSKIKPENLLCISPELRFEENNELNKRIINQVSEFKPDIVFAALGCPRQEKWLYQNMNTFGSKINIGIGATLDYFTKEKKRSPVFLQSLGLEWLWRLLLEPKRLFKRYIIQDLPFLIKMIHKINYEKK